MDEFERMIYRAPALPSVFPTRQALAEADKLQRAVRGSEINSYTDPEPHQVAVATVHTREDVVLLVSWARSSHSQLVNISRGVWVIVAMLAWYFFRH